MENSQKVLLGVLVALNSLERIEMCHFLHGKVMIQKVLYGTSKPGASH